TPSLHHKHGKHFLPIMRIRLRLYIFFTIPTINFRVLYCFIVLLHDRRKLVHFNVTEHPTAKWTTQQIIEAFPDDTSPRYLLRDRDSIYGEEFRSRVKGMQIEEVVTAPHSPFQNPYAERIIGSIRRECLDHMIVLNEDQLALARWVVWPLSASSFGPTL